MAWQGCLGYFSDQSWSFATLAGNTENWTSSTFGGLHVLHTKTDKLWVKPGKCRRSQCKKKTCKEKCDLMKLFNTGDENWDAFTRNMSTIFSFRVHTLLAEGTPVADEQTGACPHTMLSKDLVSWESPDQCSLHSCIPAPSFRDGGIWQFQFCSVSHFPNIKLVSPPVYTSVCEILVFKEFPRMFLLMCVFMHSKTSSYVLISVEGGGGY